MKITTITCHDVYNFGASLQAYALMKYLQNQGHNVEIIDYKPHYLCKYNFFTVSNAKYDKHLLKYIYILMKSPGRLKFKLSRKKQNFDIFKKKYLCLTKRRYETYDDFVNNMPEADMYLAGSDQIWNTYFSNGKDPVFYLDFVPNNKIRASYAASFATDKIKDGWHWKVSNWIQNLDFISVRESSGLKLLKNIGIENAVNVCDPVFLLSPNEWVEIETKLTIDEKYILLYDFDKNSQIQKYVLNLAKKINCKIFSVLPCSYSSQTFDNAGPSEFLYLIRNAEYVITNSFHALAFSIIFHKNFLIFNRKENLNTRMKDLVKFYDLEDLFFSTNKYINIDKINWLDIEKKSKDFIDYSKKFIDEIIASGK